jgi:ubiquinone/menaquinone biosynthesis C-methylase UbiE
MLTKKMKYKEIDNKNTADHTRAEYMYDKFCLDKSLTPEAFVDSVKNAYYKYDSEVYGQRDLTKNSFGKIFNDVFSKKEGGKVIVDIGAGTGEVYRMIKQSEYDFIKYIYIEPFSSMIEMFEDKANSNICIVNDYFDSGSCAEILSNNNEFNKIFLISAVLRTVADMTGFLSCLKKNLKKGDIIFLPLEPNNQYFGKHYKFALISMLPIRIYHKIKSIFLRMLSFDNMDKSIMDSEVNMTSQDKSITHLKDNNIVTDKFRKEMMYAFVYYNNFYCWRNIDIPEEYNDGFFTIDQVSEFLDCQISSFNTRNYMYALQTGFSFADQAIENILHYFFPKSGATFIAVLKKK